MASFAMASKPQLPGNRHLKRGKMCNVLYSVRDSVTVFAVTAFKNVRVTQKSLRQSEATEIVT